MREMALRHTFPFEAMVSVMAELGVTGLGEQDKKTGWVTHWPSEQEWRSYTCIFDNFIFRLDNAEADALATRLTETEEKYNEWLSQSGPEMTDEHRVGGLNALLSSLDELKNLICDQPKEKHLTYPYFARWLTLHIAVLGSLFVCADQERRGIIESRNAVWRLGFKYIVQATQSAYRARHQLIKIRRTRMHPVEYFLADTATNFQLTAPKAGRSFDMLELRQQEAEQLAVAYIRRAGFRTGFRMLQIFRDAAIPPTEANTDEPREEIMPMDTWHRLQRMQMTPPPVLQQGDSNGTQGGKITQSDKSRGTTKSSNDQFWTVLTEELRGNLPIPSGLGTAISMVTGILIKWIKFNQEQHSIDWEKISDELARRIELKLLQEDIEDMRGYVEAAERAFDRWLVEFEIEANKNPPEPGDELSHTQAAGLLDVFSACNLAESFILGNTHDMAGLPYVQRWFYVYTASLQVARTYPIPDIDADSRMLSLFDRVTQFMTDDMWADMSSNEQENTQTKFEYEQSALGWIWSEHWRVADSWSTITGKHKDWDNSVSTGETYALAAEDYACQRAAMYHFALLMWDEAGRNIHDLMLAADLPGWGVGDRNLYNRYDDIIQPSYENLDDARRHCHVCYQAHVHHYEEFYDEDVSESAKLKLGLHDWNLKVDYFYNPSELPETGLDPILPS